MNVFANVLAVDTAGSVCSVALASGGKRYTQSDAVYRQNHEMIFRLSESVLDEAQLSYADLDALAYGRGPGGFTGVRVAAMFVQGLAYGRGLPVVGISNLRALAQRALETYPEVMRVLACIDARMDEVYYAYYERDEHNRARACGEEAAIACKNFKLVSGTQAACGSGVALIPALQESDELQVRDAEMHAEASDVLDLAQQVIKDGEALAAEQALPTYLRHPVRNEAP